MRYCTRCLLMHCYRYKEDKHIFRVNRKLDLWKTTQLWYYLTPITQKHWFLTSGYAQSKNLRKSFLKSFQNQLIHLVEHSFQDFQISQKVIFEKLKLLKLLLHLAFSCNDKKLKIAIWFTIKYMFSLYHSPNSDTKKILLMIKYVHVEWD